MPHKRAMDISQATYRQYHPFASRQKQPFPEEKRQEALQVATEIARELHTTFGATKVVLFGSLARGQFSFRSDVDLAVWGIPPALFYRAVAFVTGYSTSWSIDLIDAAEAPPNLLQNIEKEGLEL